MTRTVLSRDMHNALKAKWLDVPITDPHFAREFVVYYQTMGWDLRLDSSSRMLSYSMPTSQLTFLLLTL